MKVIDYAIFTIAMDSPTKNPAEEIIKKLKEGWQPIGGIHVMMLPVPASVINNQPQMCAVYTQAMVKYEEVH